CVGLALDFVMYELRRSEQRERTRSRILEMLARDAPLLEIMQTIVAIVEKENQDMACCILLVGDDGEQIFSGSVSSVAASSLAAGQMIEVNASTRLYAHIPSAEQVVAIGKAQQRPGLV